MKLNPNVSYNCNCKKLEQISDNDIKNNIQIKKTNKKNSQIITFYKNKNKEEKNKTLF